MTIEELQVNATEASQAQESAVKEFESQRGTASIVDLGKLANAVTSATRKAESTARELADFALVGIYESVKAQILKLGDKLLSGADIATLLEKNVSTLSVSVALSSDGLGDVVVNTLGRKTRVASSGNGTRTRWEMRNDATNESLECRAFLEQYGDAAFGTDAKVTAQMVLEAPAKYGLSDYAARAGAKLDPTWQRVQKDE